MWKTTLIYGISTGINRGAAMLCLPFLTSLLSLDELGIYSLIQTAAQLFVPLISLNGSAAIMREGPQNLSIGFGLFHKFIAISLLLGGALSLISFGVLPTTYQWISYAIMLGLLEAVHSEILTWFVCVERRKYYSVFVSLKSIMLVGILAGANYGHWSLSLVILSQLAWYALLACLSIYFVLKVRCVASYNVSLLKKTLRYTIPLIPHSIALWIMSSSNRFIVKGIMGDAAVGLYSIAYTVALVLMLLNSGIAVALPKYMIENYQQWVDGNLREKGIRVYNWASIVFVLLVFMGLEFDKHITHFVGYYVPSLPIMIGFIMAGIYLLGIYNFYCNYLFYHKRTGMMSMQTIAAALFNIMSTYFLVNIFGIIGAAMAALVTYAFYLVCVIWAAQKCEPILLKKLPGDLRYVIPVCLIIMAFSVFQTYYWKM